MKDRCLRRCLPSIPRVPPLHSADPFPLPPLHAVFCGPFAYTAVSFPQTSRPVFKTPLKAAHHCHKDIPKERLLVLPAKEATPGAFVPRLHSFSISFASCHSCLQATFHSPQAAADLPLLLRLCSHPHSVKRRQTLRGEVCCCTGSQSAQPGACTGDSRCR